MKAKNSKTTGLALVDKTQQKKTGSPLGAIGSSMPVSDLQKVVATPEHIAQCRQWLMDLSKLPLKEISANELHEANKAIKWMLKPAPQAWIASRIVTLLSHYFVTQTDERVARAAAKDWMDILENLPAWSISMACKDWISGSSRQRRPQAGDILFLAKERMWLVNAAESALKQREERIEKLENFEKVSDQDRRRIGSGLADLAKSLRFDGGNVEY